MTIGTDLVIVHIQKTQPLDDALRGQVVAVTDVGFDEVEGLVFRAEALHRHTHRLNHADGVSQLDFALVSVARLAKLIVQQLSCVDIHVNLWTGKLKFI